ncbi:MAG: porin family protein [Bacteroidales bacterium]|nr:porin family protein [Bacteroidales bacterium]
MRKILVAIVALMTSLSAFAADIDLFFKGGVSISKFNVDESENRMGVAAGFGGKFHISNSRFFIMPELMYAQKGQENEVVFEEKNKAVIPCMFHMVELPVLFGGKIELPVKDMHLNVGAGPYIGYDFRFNENSENMKFVRDTRDSRNAMKLISHGDLGVAFNLEFHYKRLFVFYDYDLGLRDLTQNTSVLGQTLCHRNMRIGAGYTFPTLTIGKQRKKPQM